MRALEIRLMAPAVRAIEDVRATDGTSATSGACALDVGCAHGLYSLDIARRGAVLVGCDLERSALAVARQTAQGLGLSDRTLYLAADGSRLPLPDRQFDLVVCNCVLEHIVDDGAALAAMARSLRPGGTLYLTVDNADHGLALDFLERLPQGVNKLLLRPQVAGAPTVSEGLDARLDRLYAVLRRYHRDDLLETVSDLGLTVLECRPYLTGVGAAHYEAFHAFRGLDPAKGVGRVLYMLSSLLLYPFAAWSDNRRDARGHGLAVAARLEGEGSP
jgi:SAM-dependent methyltransferase